MASYYRFMLCIGAIALVACSVIGRCEADTISDACQTASNPQFCITSLSNANGGSNADITQLSVIAVDLTASEASVVSNNLTLSNITQCVEIFAGIVTELKQSLVELKGLPSGNFQSIISDAKKSLDDVGSNINDCYVRLKESGATDLIPIVVQNTENLTLLTSDAQSVVSFLGQHGAS